MCNLWGKKNEKNDRGRRIYRPKRFAKKKQLYKAVIWVTEVYYCRISNLMCGHLPAKECSLTDAAARRLTSTRLKCYVYSSKGKTKSNKYGDQIVVHVSPPSRPCLLHSRLPHLSLSFYFFILSVFARLTSAHMPPLRLLVSAGKSLVKTTAIFPSTPITNGPTP